MECKWAEEFFCAFAIVELIDTLWNVNEVTGIDEEGFSYELIDTLWNVNVDIAKASIEHAKEN